jgi:cyclohexa-1,5-dienecarbonyl-CoA hydratase
MNVSSTRCALLEVQPPAARITLHKPPLNVLDLPMIEQMVDALSEIESQPGISTILISGKGEHFSAGVDVAAHTLDKVESMLAKFHSVIRALVATKRVTIASVKGHCLGGGAELALVCDLVFTAEDAQWGFPEIKLGCYPPVAVTSLAALVGQKRASDLILTGRSITGIEAANIGLATHAVPGAQLTAAVEEALLRLAKLSPAALGATKRAIYVWDSMHFDKGLARAERIYLDELMKTEDAQEGIRAFMKKRQPVWKGK